MVDGGRVRPAPRRLPFPLAEPALPSQQYSLLRRIFEDINEDFQNPENKVVVRDREGNEREVARIERLEQLLKLVMNLLKTDEFKRVEASIKQNVLEQLGLDAEADDIDLYFTPMSSMDFYKNLDLIIKDHGFSISATEVGEGFQNAIVLAILRAFEETQRQGAILLIEEPEMFLHPQMQRSLYKTLRKIGETNQSSTPRTRRISFPFRTTATCSSSAAATKALTSSNRLSRLTTSAARSS
jgi:putative ATP-dependent endonuclease of OLD family